MKPIVRRAKADEDIQKAIEYFVLTAPEYSSAFVDSLQQAYRHIQKHPESGAPRYAHALDLPGLRFWQCKRFPYLIFYRVFETRIEVWRVLHAHQDIPTSLRVE